ncbi:MAG: DUF937 domain-containing protein [Leptolyngbya sp. LCM1.Bin17]|nr:MAG: DUF937 domain-containing protein [Leptolyngbya sp. LCM1.Bin17]
MSLFFNVLSSINNPNQQGSIDQLSSVMNSVQQLTASQGLKQDQMASVLNSLGGALQPALKQQSATMGGGQMDGLIGQLANAGGSLTGLQSAIPPQMQQQLIQSVAQKSGLNAGMVQAMLPKLLPMVMGLLGMGAAKPGATQGGNALLDAFLNSGSGNSTDLGTVMKFAGRFLNPPT